MSERGFALLIVLWLLVPLSALFLTLSGSARSDSQRTFNLRDAAHLEASADAGIESEIFSLLQRGATSLQLSLGGAAVSIQAESLSGRINPNTAPPELLAALLVRLGASTAQADGLAAAIVNWRTPVQQRRQNGANGPEYRAAGLDYGPPGAPFESIDEVRLVLGLTPALFTALQPNLTLYTDRPPDPATAPPAVRAALGDLGFNRGEPGSSDVFLITADARAPDGSRVLRRATVRFGASAAGRPWRVFDWGTVDPR